MAAADFPGYRFKGSKFRPYGALREWANQSHEAVLEPDLPIVDPHHHLYDDERGRYLMDDMLADIGDGHDIRGTVFLEARARYRTDGPVELRPVGETGFARDVFAACADGGHSRLRLCAGIVGFADLTLGDAVEQVLEAHFVAGAGLFRGIRHPAQCDESVNAFLGFLPPRGLLGRADFRRGFARLAPHGLSYDAWQFYPQLPELRDLARAFPETTIVLNHVGGILGVNAHAGRRAEILEIWRGHIRELATCPNIVVKLGGLGMLSCGFDFHLRDTPPASEELAQAWRPYFETCIEAFGPSRCMFESNFPPDKQSCSYGTMWNAFKRIVASCSADEKTQLFSGTATRVYRLGDIGGIS